MKKAYVKVKTPSAKTVLKRPYIAVTILCAAVCAIVLSVAVGQREPEVLRSQQEIVSEEAKSVAKPTIAPIEISNPSTDIEVIEPDETEIENIEETVSEAVEEGVSAGFFGGVSNISMIRPVEGEILKDYSNNKPVKSKTMGDWRVHKGIDLRAEKGTEVKAPASGEIIEAKTDNLTGCTVSIDHGHGIVSTVYNLESIDGVSIGQKVNSGDVIGKAGNTAKTEMLEDPHIHFEVTKDGAFEDPKSYIE